MDIRNGKEEIDINDLDKLPYEILFFISCIAISGVIAILEYTSYNDSILNLNMIIGNWITAYLVRICYSFNKCSYIN